MRRLAFITLIIVAALAARGACAADAACMPAVRQVSVDQDIQKVAVSMDLDLAAIGTMATKMGASMVHPPEGFYFGLFFYTVDVDPVEVAGDCAAPVTIRLHVHLAKRVIEIGRELQDRPCRREAELEHYRRHAAADEAVIARYTALIRDHLTAEPINPGNLTEWVKSIVDRDIAPLNDDRRAAQDAVNTPDEFSRIDQACSV